MVALTRSVDPGLGAGPAHGVRHLLAAHVLALDHDGGRQRGVTKPPEHNNIIIIFIIMMVGGREASPNPLNTGQLYL